jgi:hypothetical protein
MQQKVIVYDVAANLTNSAGAKRITLTEVDTQLNNGYHVVNVYQLSGSPGFITYVFVLQKE